MLPMADFKLKPFSFQEAIDFFKDKVTLTPAQFRKLAQEYQSLAFTVSGIAAMDVLSDIYTELLKAIEKGLTAQEFADSAQDIFERKGWEGLTPYRVDTIFRTNVQTAYMVGHYRRMTDPDVVDRRPYWQYDAVNDRRTRPAHRALDGKVFRYDDPFWDTWYPPNGFRCRCAVRSLSEGEMKQEGRTVETKIPTYIEPPGMPAIPLYPDTGFDYNPGKAKWEPDLSKYPKPLQAAYTRRSGERG
jgi:SPP1 gp7 family putative phage head morphogenesis protein